MAIAEEGRARVDEEKDDGRRETLDRFCAYVVEAVRRPMPDEVTEATSLHLLDTLAATISGATLQPGRLAVQFAIREQAQGPASLIGTGSTVSASLAAFANGVAAHADETDDTNRYTLTHPGCSVIPAALAVAEQQRRSGAELLRAVALGYDAAGRMALALGPSVRDMRQNVVSTHAIGGCFGAAFAAGSLYGLDCSRIAYLLTYTAQQASGVPTFLRDVSHIGKAFVFGGLPGRNGVWAASLVANGFTAEPDVMEGSPNFLDALGGHSCPDELASELGIRWEVSRTDIKKYCVGAPLQAVVEAVSRVLSETGWSASDIDHVNVFLSSKEAYVVGSRTMSDIDLTYIVSIMLLDGVLSFDGAHDYTRMTDPRVIDMRERIKVIVDSSMESGSRQARVAMRSVSGVERACHVRVVRGAAQDPMSRDEVEEKARELISPVTGKQVFEDLLSVIRELPAVRDVGESLTPVLSRVIVAPER